MDSVDLHLAEASHASAIAELVTQLGYPTSREQMARRLAAILADREHETLVAFQDGRIVGFVGTRLALTYESDEPFGEIRAMAVAAGFRCRGIGRRAGAHLFYEAQGYAFTGRRDRKSP